MTKKEFEQKVAEKTGESLKCTSNMINAVFDTLTECIATGDSIAIKGFGTFEKSHREERKGRNPRTGEETVIAACDVPKFKAAKALKEECNK